jgi:3-phosphoglycerate kinase
MIKSVDDANFKDKRVLVRVDFNVPLDDNGKITDDNRIVQSLPTIDKIIDDGGIPVLMSHLGRPKGERNEKYSLKPVARHLKENFGYDVIFADDCIGENAYNAVKEAAPGKVVLLENLRFHKEEEKNDKEFAGQIASLGDAYVNDAFGSAHRAHASTVGVAELFEDRYAGKLLIKEIDYLGTALSNPQRPFVTIIGGAKISDKINVIRNLMDICDSILIGGAMMFTFYRAKGFDVGKSLVEEDKVGFARQLMEEAQAKNIRLLIPVDVVIAKDKTTDAETKNVMDSEIPFDWMGLDIGSETIKMFKDEIVRAKTVIWNGPMGLFEVEKFARGTMAVAEALTEVTENGGITIIGGGDTAAAIKNTDLEEKITHISTGGGASLEYLEGIKLPGVAVLEM